MTESTVPIPPQFRLIDGRVYSPEGIPFVPAHVSLISIADTNGKFYLVPPPQDHSFETAVGKWDLFSTEYLPDEDPILTLHTKLSQAGADIVAFFRLGRSRTVSFYPERGGDGEYRDTNRLFYCTTVEADQEEALRAAGLVPMSIGQIFSTGAIPKLDFRRSAIAYAVRTHMRKALKYQDSYFDLVENEASPQHQKLVEVYLRATAQYD